MRHFRQAPVQGTRVVLKTRSEVADDDQHGIDQAGASLEDAVQLGVRALSMTQNKTLSERDLEVAVLDRTKERRKFRRIPPEALSQLLGAAK